MLDAFAHDTRDDSLVLAMFETRPWDLGDHQLWQLQEKLNAYVSFILDGELRETFPHLAGKPVRIELRTVHEPSEQAMGFLGRARDQLAMQEITLEAVLIGEVGEASGGCCGGGGGCCGGGGRPQEEKQGCCGGGHDDHHDEHENHGEGHHHGCGCSH
jgi:hypothetical protein